ncbi:MAG: pro-sigmaK processing inhibitor BofA family protein [Clostridia bacterium]|nr:pro-sigmaK processing inhibitor BofA family protein [Clostridia bacterium]
MNSGKILLGVLLAIYIIVIFIAYFKSKRFFTALLFTALQGICALFAVNLIGKYITIHIPINAWTIGLSSLGGVSGVIMLLLCDIFMY